MPEYLVEMAMCYSKPSLDSAYQAFEKAGLRTLYVVPLYPQYSATTTAAVFDQLFKVLNKCRFLPELHLINQYADHPAYIKAITSSIKAYWEKHGQSNYLLYSFHGLPKKQFEKGDPYYCFCHKTQRLVQEALACDVPQEMVFQSQFGPSQWLEPACEARLIELAKQGVKSIDVVCPGFSVDCLETLDEIENEYAEVFEQHGGETLRYIPALNDSDAQVSMFQEILKDYI